MLGYDDIYSIEYFYERRMAYWKHNGQVSIFDAFERARLLTLIDGTLPCLRPATDG